MFYLVRHGETDYSMKNSKIYQGFGVNLAPLSGTGIQQICQTARDARLAGTEVILSSPYTRALQTAAILSRKLGAPIIVETDLHEWLADKYYTYLDDETAEKNYREYTQQNGCYLNGTQPSWESAEMMRERVIAVLQKYAHYKKVVVACHGMMMQAVTGIHHPNNGEIVKLEL